MYISHLLDERRKLQRVYSATMASIRHAAKARLIQQLQSLATDEFQEPEAAEDPPLSHAFPMAAKSLHVADVKATCPLDAERLPKELCPLMNPTR
jgi:hypothetical protein